MPEYDNTNRGVLFRNNKARGDRDPEFQGNAEVDCPHCNRSIPFWISAWVRESKKKVKFFSMAFKLKTGGQGGAPAEDEIPF